MENDIIGIAAFGYIAFLFSTVCHEAAHALAAKLGGDLTAYHSGQVSLSPIPHIRREPFGLGLLPLLTLLTSVQSGGLGVFGYASAPFDPYWAMRHPKRAAWMAMAGPGANLVLAAVAVLALKAGLWTGVFHPGETIAVWKLAHAATPVAEAVAVFFSILYFENLLLATWNLLPIPPMDGFSMLLFVVPESKAGTVFAIRNQLGLMFPILIFVLSGVFWRFFRPVLWYTIDLFFG